MSWQRYAKPRRGALGCFNRSIRNTLWQWHGSSIWKPGYCDTVVPLEPLHRTADQPHRLLVRLLPAKP
jgi:hypothetical protein